MYNWIKLCVLTLFGLLCLCFPLQLAPEQVACLRCSQGDLTWNHSGFILLFMERAGPWERADVLQDKAGSLCQRATDDC